MNIMINDNCNLQCEYCFAPKDNVKRISTDDFNYFVGFLKRSNQRSLRILGGEPILHPNFIDFVKTGIEDDFFNGIVIFTNGLGLTKKISEQIVSRKTSVLVNLNSPQDIGSKNYNKTLENIKTLAVEYKNRNFFPRVMLGINIYKEDFDYQYLLDACEEVGTKLIRYSISVPTGSEKVTLDYYRQYIPRVMEFLDKCHELGLSPNLDCNNIPTCLFTAEQLTNLIGSRQNMITARQFCEMPIDVTPNLEVSRCMAFMDTQRVNLKDYNKAQELQEYFYTIIDSKKFIKPSFEECTDCKLFEEGKCQGSCLCNKFR